MSIHKIFKNTIRHNKESGSTLLENQVHLDCLPSYLISDKPLTES